MEYFSPCLTEFTSLSHSYNVLVTLFWVDCRDIGVNKKLYLIKCDNNPLHLQCIRYNRFDKSTDFNTQNRQIIPKINKIQIKMSPKEG